MPVSVSREYFEDVYTLLPDEVFVDCGAYSGDTLRDFLEVGGRLKEYHAFEPDPGNFSQLSAYAEALPTDFRGKIHLHQNAVGHERATIFLTPRARWVPWSTRMERPPWSPLLWMRRCAGSNPP